MATEPAENPENSPASLEPALSAKLAVSCGQVLTPVFWCSVDSNVTAVVPSKDVLWSCVLFLRCCLVIENITLVSGAQSTILVLYGCV